MSKKTRLMKNWAVLNKMLFGSFKTPNNINENTVNKINSYKSQMLYNVEELYKLVNYNSDLNINCVQDFKKSLNESFSKSMTYAKKIMEQDENIKNMIRDDIKLVLETTNYNKDIITDLILKEHFLKTAIDRLLINPVLQHIKECNCAKHLKSEISVILETHANYRNNLVNSLLYNK